MAKVDYAAIRAAIITALTSYPAMAGVTVVIEEEVVPGIPDTGIVVAVYGQSRGAPPGEQMISAGRRLRMELRHEIWVMGFDMESFRAACDRRDQYMGEVELALLASPSLSGLAETSWMEGGALLNARGESPNGQVFVAAAQVVLVSRVNAILS